jgi:very-short-patch-repair endonuclease
MVRISADKVKFSRRLRSNLTDAEKLLWKHLRLKQLDAFRFRRQHPLGEYVVDFACIEAALVVEVDGGQHSERREQDALRSNGLAAQGFRVLRFWNNEVLQNIEGVMYQIRAALSVRANPHPNLPPRKGKESGSGSAGR